MIFEEEFPSLKGCIEIITDIKGELPRPFVRKGIVKAVCLDNRRVKELIIDQLYDMQQRKKETGKHCFYEHPKDEAVALCVRLLNGLELLKPQEINDQIKELKL